MRIDTAPCVAHLLLLLHKDNSRFDLKMYICKYFIFSTNGINT